MSFGAAFFKPFSPLECLLPLLVVVYCTIFSCLLSIALVAIPPKAEALGFPRAVAMKEAARDMKVKVKKGE